MTTEVKTRTRATRSKKAKSSAVDLAEASRRMLEEPFNQAKFDLLDELLASNAMNHDPALPPRMRGLRGPELAKQTAILYRAAFPDLRITVDDVIATDDTVVLRWHAEGTHRGELEGLAPTEARVVVTGIAIDRWESGKVVEAWTQWDNLGLARQLGAAPPEGSIVEKIGMQAQRMMAARARRRHG